MRTASYNLPTAVFLSLVAHAQAVAASDTVENIKVVGSYDFVERTRESMELLKDTKSFATIKPFIHNIKEGERSGMRAWEDATFVVGDRTWKHSAMWYAGTIVHDGCHSKLYHEKKPWTGPDAEVVCLKIQAEALREMKASPSLISHVEAFEDNPESYIGTGSREDYEKRNW